MNCKSAQNLLSEYLDQELTGARSLQVRAHLSVCKDCDRYYQELLATVRSLNYLTVEEPGELRFIPVEAKSPVRWFAVSAIAATFLIMSLAFQRLSTKSEPQSQLSVDTRFDRQLREELKQDQLSFAGADRLNAGGARGTTVSFK